ncbi:MAG: tRNA (N(6)-L-threonylcarbamoyladenosine(37)-C(2))-methylthiotransferase MtaB [Proteobacteria bacterium]|nr:tRNA (N(6)-L-threonylcarbamoyladenosine(37)-C(2))-methylthiotransferase MtaB [Pseudomonadota bacterium]
MRVAIATLGCKANQYDSEIIREAFEEKNFGIVSFSDVADIYVINTCTVTGKTDYQSRQLIRRAHRINPNAKIVVTGCYAQVAPHDLKKIPGVSLVVGNSDKSKISDLLINTAIDKDTRIVVNPFEKSCPFPEEKIKRFFSKTRFFLKIQDGCNAHCSYCIIPTSRGPSRSMNPKTVLELLRRIGSSGYKEVVLTGIHLGAYGLDLPSPTTLFQLLQQIEKEKPIPRVRLSSIEPNEVDQKLIDLIGSSEIICPHLHLPLQSGDNAILRRMNRPYSSEDFRQLIKNVADSIPDLNVGVDVIVGFPGEEECQFQQTFQLIKELPVAYLHVFPFSPRKGTAAARFSERIAGNTVKSRGSLLRILGSEKRRAFYKSYLNKKLRVLIESRREKNRDLLKGFSRNYIPVLVDGGNEFINKEVTVRIIAVDGETVRGIMEK